MTIRNPALQAKRDRNDLLAAIAVGALATGLLLYDGIRRILALFFTPDAITVQAPVQEQPLIAAIGEGVPATTGTVTMIVQNVGLANVVCLVLGIVLTTGGLVIAAVLGTIVCRRMLQAKIFDRTNTRLTLVTSLVLLVAGVGGGMWLPNMGLNGVFTAAGGEFDGQFRLMLDSVPTFAASFAVGVLVIVFRRGATLQRDTEGLV